MKTLFLKLWAKFKAPFVFAGLALAALVIAMADAYRAGKRSEKRRTINEETKRETDKIDAMAGAGDASGLADDILKRVGK